MTDPLRDLTDDDLFGEMRRRMPAIPDDVIDRQLGLERRTGRDEGEALRRIALLFLAGITFVLVVFIGGLAVAARDIPDLLSGLAGSGIGAIAGILSNPGGTGPDRRGPSRASPA